MDIDLLLESEGLFQTTFPDGCSFTWRLLTLKEYRVFRALREAEVLPPFHVYMEVFQRVFVGDLRVLSKNIKAGACISIGQLCMYLSGDCELETLKNDLALARRTYASDSMHEHMKHIILTALPAYTLEDIDSWTRPELIRKFVISESILAKRGDYQPINLKDIRPASEVDKKPAHGIDFERENAAIRKAMGPFAEYEAQETPRLTPRQLQQLEKKRRMRRRG